MKKKASVFDLFKNEIEEYLKIGLSIRCIYLLIKHKIEKENLLAGNTVSYQGIRRYILANFSNLLKKT